MFKLTKDLIRQGASYLKRDEPALLTFLFHSIFRDESEYAAEVIDPQQHITVDIYRQFVEYFLEAGYEFISPPQLDELKADGKYVLSTFDDGYYNNSLVLPLLNEYKTPALFFVVSDNIINNKCYWWDIVFRELSKKGLKKKVISNVKATCKNLTHEEITIKLHKLFGPNCFQPICDIDRPFTVSELKDFSKSKLVFIGNHTRNHCLLDHCSKEVQRDQVVQCQVDLKTILGYEPETVSYPNGNYNLETLDICRELKFSMGITLNKHKNYFPLKDRMALGRFVLWGNKPLKRQLDFFRSDFGTKGR